MKKIITTFMMMLCAACVASGANYLTFTAEEDSSTFGIVYEWSGLLNDWPNIQYSLDEGETWSKLAIGDIIILEKKGDKALIRGYNENGMGHWSTWEHDGTESNYQYNYTQFVMTGAIAASGSVMSLIDGIGETLVVPSDKCFFSLFSGCTSLTKAPELPATSLASYCYSGMFSGCTSLTNAPNLPATTLEWNCYEEMFSGCTNLTNAPNLPVTTLASYCYSGMFSGCTNLTKVSELPATSLAYGCYQGMFSGCTSLTNAPNLPATTLEEYCYEKMFSGCTNLTKAPELPATSLASNCYSGMFSGCTNLSEISVDFTKWGSGHTDWHTDFWVENVAPTGTFYCPKELPLEHGVDRIPEGWTVKHIEVGVNATLADNITVWSDDLTIYVRGAKGEVSIYDLSGKRVAVSYSADEERALSVPSKGVYVVRTNNGTSDVLVR